MLKDVSCIKKLNNYCYRQCLHGIYRHRYLHELMCNKTKDVTCVKVCLIFTQKGIANFYLTVIRWNSQNGKPVCTCVLKPLHYCILIPLLKCPLGVDRIEG